MFLHVFLKGFDHNLVVSIFDNHHFIPLEKEHNFGLIIFLGYC